MNKEDATGRLAAWTREEQVELIRHKYTALAPLLNERTRRCWAATEAHALGYGGISRVAEALGIARGTIHAGLAAAVLPLGGRERAGLGATVAAAAERLWG